VTAISSRLVLQPPAEPSRAVEFHSSSIAGNQHVGTLVEPVSARLIERPINECYF
jgi:hypothetical protein